MAMNRSTKRTVTKALKIIKSLGCENEYDDYNERYIKETVLAAENIVMEKCHRVAISAFNAAIAAIMEYMRIGDNALTAARVEYDRVEAAEWKAIDAADETGQDDTLSLL